MISQATAESTTETPGTSLLEFMVGPDPEGPEKCLHCLEEFKPGEPWQRMTAPDGSYRIGIHSACVNTPGAQA